MPPRSTAVALAVVLVATAAVTTTTTLAIVTDVPHCRCCAALALMPLLTVEGDTKGPKSAATRPAAKVWFAVDVEVLRTRMQATEQNQQAPIKMVSRRAWSPGIYWALRLLGKTLDVAWERAFIRSLTFNQ